MATKTLRVTLADILGPAGPAGRVHGEVWAAYVDGNGNAREIRKTDGTVILPAKPRQPIDATGVVDFVVTPSDDASIMSSDQGFGVKVGWDLTTRGTGGGKVSITNSGTVVQVVAADASVVQFGLKAPYVPVIAGSTYLTQATGDVRYATPSALTAKLDTTTAAATYETKTNVTSGLAGKIDKGALVINARDYGAVGDGTTDDTAAVQAALNAAGTGGRVVLPKGTFGTARFRVKALTFPAAFMSLEGAGAHAVGSGSSTSAELVFADLTSRTVADGATTSGSATVTSATAAFTSADVGRVVSGTGIPLGATITAVGSGTSVTISVNATATATGVSLTFADVGITMNSSCRLHDVLLRGPGYTSGVVGVLSKYPTVRMDGVQINTFGTGCILVSVFYGFLTNVEFRQNALALGVNNCYNLRLINQQINGVNGAGFGNGILMYGACMMSLNGGTVEQTAVGITMTGVSSLHMWGTYWETAATNAVGVKASGINGHQVVAQACQVYIQNFTAWIDFQTTSSGTLTAGGNYFKAVSTSTPAAPVAYAYDAGPTSEISLGAGLPDNWQSVLSPLAAALYTNRDGTRLNRVTVATPNQYTNNATDAGSLRIGKDVRLSSTHVIVTGAGVTGSRPTAASAGPGANFYDSTLTKPIWSDGTNWRDATGTVV